MMFMSIRNIEMKRILILGLHLLFSLSNVNAQEKDLKTIYKDVTTAINSALLTKSGSLEIAGFVSYNYFHTKYTYEEEISQHIFQVEPIFLYFIVDNISLGANLSFLSQKTGYESSRESTTLQQTFIGPIAKIYFGTDKFRPFLLVDYLFTVGDHYDGGELDLGAGIFYHVTGNIGFSLFGKYGILWSSKDDIKMQNRIFIGLGISSFIL